MSELAYKPRGRYFEDFEIGERIMSAGRTLTESDLVTFAGLSGDFNQIHTDAAFAAAGPFGQRIIHGLLVVSVATGLIVQTGMMEGTVIAFRELTWKFSQPVYIGDTVRAVVDVKELKALPRLGGGNLITKVSVLNQEDNVVNRGTMTLLIMSRPT
jgi:acyl dehydratase